MGIGPFNNVNLKPLDIIRTITIIGGHIYYYHTAWRDVPIYHNLGPVIFGQFLLTFALTLSVMDNFGYAPKIRGKLREKLLQFFDWIQGVNKK